MFKPWQETFNLNVSSRDIIFSWSTVLASLPTKTICLIMTGNTGRTRHICSVKKLHLLCKKITLVLFTEHEDPFHRTRAPFLHNTRPFCTERETLFYRTRGPFLQNTRPLFTELKAPFYRTRERFLQNARTPFYRTRDPFLQNTRFFLQNTRALFTEHEGPFYRTRTPPKALKKTW